MEWIFFFQCVALYFGIYYTTRVIVRTIYGTPIATPCWFYGMALSWAAFFCLSYLPDFLY